MSMIDYWLVGGYLFLILVLGLNAGRKVDSLRQFSIAGGRYGFMVVFATLSASYIGGGFTMGNAREVYLLGIANIVAIWGFSLKELMVGWLLAPRMKHFPNAMSVGDITGAAYGKPTKVLTGLFGMALCIAIVGAQVGAMGALFSYFLGIDQLVGVAVGCSIVIVYSTFGGMRAVVVTDIVQFILLAVGLPVTLVLGIQAVGGLDSVRQAVPAEHFNLFANHSVLGFVSIFLVLFMGEALVPPYLQRLMIGDPKSVAWGTVLSGLFSIPFFAITGTIGLVALAMNNQLENPDQTIPFMVDQAVPWGIKGMVVAGLLSVSMSSADSFLNSAAVCLTHDVIQPLRGDNPLNTKTELLLARLTTALGGIAAVIFAVTIDGLLQILFYAYNFWAPVVLVPIVAALLGFRASWKVVFLAAATGVGGNLLWAYFSNPEAGRALADFAAFDGLIVGVAANALVIGGAWMAQARQQQAA